MTARIAFDAALEAARAWQASIPAMAAFCDWPDDISYANRPAVALPVIAHLQNDPGRATAASQPLRDAIIALAPYIEWRLSYTEAEVGADFLRRFGWFELVGPFGHFHSDKSRMTVGYWGSHLDYPRHQHEPEELYSVVSGSAVFMADGEDNQTLGPGDTRLHLGNQPHAMKITDQPVLTFVLWRGNDLADAPKMSAT